MGRIKDFIYGILTKSSEMERLSDDNFHLRTMLDGLKKDNERLISRNRALDEENDMLDKKIDEIREKNDRLKLDLDQYERSRGDNWHFPTFQINGRMTHVIAGGDSTPTYDIETHGHNANTLRLTLFIDDDMMQKLVNGAVEQGESIHVSKSADYNNQ